MTTLQKIIKYCALAFAIFLVVSITSGICGALGIVSGILDGNNGKDGDAVGETKTYTVSSEIENLDIEISAAALEIVTGDSFSVESNHKYLSVTEKNGTLRIEEEKTIFGVSSNGVMVVLTVPEGFVFEDISISAGAGKVSIAALAANTLTLDLGAGATEIDWLNIQTRAKINSGTGKLTISNGELHDLSMDIGVGKLELTGKLTGRCSVDYGIGDAELTLRGNKEDYQIEIDKGVGGATLAGKSMSDDSIYGSGANRIDIDGGIGSINIEFENDTE